MFKGLRNQFLFLHMGIVTLLIVVFFGTLMLLNYQNIQRNADMLLGRNLELPQIQRFNDLPQGGESKVRMHQDMMRIQGGEMQPRFSPVFVVILDENKNVIYTDSRFELEESFYTGITKAAITHQKRSDIIKYDNAYFKYRQNDERIVFLDISKEMQMFTSSIYTMLWIAIPMLVLIFFISLYFANRSIKPIEESYNRQKAFIADASHELKTPLAVISTNVDMLLPEARGEQQKWLFYIKSEIERMTNLTESLLYLTRLDYVKGKSDMQTVDFSKTLEDYLMPLEAMFYENKVKTKIDILPDIKVHGDDAQLRRLVGILVDNAIKYTDGQLRINLGKVGAEAVLTVYNTGNGIAADEIEKIWDRFYRSDKSRENAGGFGLGLPIAKAIAEKHKGIILAESVEYEWARFTLRIPLEK